MGKLTNLKYPLKYTSTDFIAYTGELPDCLPSATSTCNPMDRSLTKLFQLLLEKYCEPSANPLDVDISELDIECLLEANPDIEIGDDLTLKDLLAYFKDHLCYIYTKLCADCGSEPTDLTCLINKQSSCEWVVEGIDLRSRFCFDVIELNPPDPENSGGMTLFLHIEGTNVFQNFPIGEGGMPSSNIITSEEQIENIINTFNDLGGVFSYSIEGIRMCIFIDGVIENYIFNIDYDGFFPSQEPPIDFYNISFYGITPTLITNNQSTLQYYISTLPLSFQIFQNGNWVSVSNEYVINGTYRSNEEFTGARLIDSEENLIQEFDIQVNCETQEVSGTFCEFIQDHEDRITDLENNIEPSSEPFLPEPLVIPFVRTFNVQTENDIIFDISEYVKYNDGSFYFSKTPDGTKLTSLGSNPQQSIGLHGKTWIDSDSKLLRYSYLNTPVPGTGDDAFLFYLTDGLGNNYKFPVSIYSINACCEEVPPTGGSTVYSFTIELDVTGWSTEPAFLETNIDSVIRDPSGGSQSASTEPGFIIRLNHNLGIGTTYMASVVFLDGVGGSITIADKQNDHVDILVPSNPLNILGVNIRIKVTIMT